MVDAGLGKGGVAASVLDRAGLTIFSLRWKVLPLVQKAWLGSIPW